MKRVPMQQRLWLRVTKDDDGCWRWHGATQNGYGVIVDLGKNYFVHRVSWEMARSPIPPGLTIDHLCMVRNCVNPDHLEVVTRGENTRRMAQTRAPRTACRKGHTYVDGSYQVEAGSRRCLLCRSLEYAARRAAR